MGCCVDSHNPVCVSGSRRGGGSDGGGGGGVVFVTVWMLVSCLERSAKERNIRRVQESFVVHVGVPVYNITCSHVRSFFYVYIPNSLFPSHCRVIKSQCGNRQVMLISIITTCQ